jgi:hypothetical protein
MIVESKEEEQEEKLFFKRLKYLYKKLNTNSSLFWTHENHLLGKRLRSEINNDKSNNNWKNSPAVQTGYGEVTMVYHHLNKGFLY